MKGNAMKAESISTISAAIARTSPPLPPPSGARERTRGEGRKGSSARAEAGAESRFDIVRSEAIRFFPELVEHWGGNPRELLRLARIDPAIAAKRGSVLPYCAMIDLLEIAATELQCSDFGLRLATLQGGTRAMGPIGVVMKNSKTVGQALGYCKKQIHAYCLATCVRFVPDRTRHRLFVGLEILLDGLTDSSQMIEYALMLANLNVADISGGAARARQISFRHAPLRALSAYREAFKCEVRFGEDSDGLVLEERDLLCPVIDPDEEVYEIATSFIADHYPRAIPPLHARVRNLISRYLGNDCANERIAAELCMHPRSLQRRLRSEGKSFETIKDEVRQQAALRYLQCPDLPLTHVAAKLGYADQSVLSRSCWRWFATTPGELRQRAMAVEPQREN